MKILVSDTLSDNGIQTFKKTKGIELIYEPGLGKNIPKLKTIIEDVDAMAIRSDTKLTADILRCAKKLKVIGRAGIGVDNIDVAAASQQGIIVMNTPQGNMVTTAEHAIAMMCAISRSIPQATSSLKAGKWEKNKFMGAELYKKTLGIIGCGNIGKIVAERAQGFNMKVIAFDPFLPDALAEELKIEKVSLDDLLKRADFISIHAPLNEKTRHMIHKPCFEKMKKGVYLINCARGGIVKEDDLLWALEQDIVAGAALDVFEKEPVDPQHPLLKSDKVIATPHLGASTEEAQENVAIDVATQIIDYLLNGNIVNAVNTASASAEVLKLLGPYIQLGQKMGLWHGQLCEEAPTQIHINYYGEMATHQIGPITTAVLQGILQPMLTDISVNHVNAPYLAKERGIQVKESKINKHPDYLSLLEVILFFKENKQTSIAGSIFGKSHLRIVSFNKTHAEVNPVGTILMISNHDRPGVIGKLGTFLGQHHVNISNMQLGLDEETGMALAFYSVQGPVTADVLAHLREIDGIVSVNLLNL